MDHYDRINDYEHYIMIVCYCGFRKKKYFLLCLEIKNYINEFLRKCIRTLCIDTYP